jgi:hypothetical protein
MKLTPLLESFKPIPDKLLDYINKKLLGKQYELRFIRGIVTKIEVITHPAHYRLIVRLDYAHHNDEMIINHATNATVRGKRLTKLVQCVYSDLHNFGIENNQIQVDVNRHDGYSKLDAFVYAQGLGG